MRLRSRIWMVACTLSWLAYAGEFPRNQLIEGFLSYIQKVDNVVLDAAKLAEARQGLQKSPPGEPLLQPYVFVGDRLGREALMVRIDAGILMSARVAPPERGPAVSAYWLSQSPVCWEGTMSTCFTGWTGSCLGIPTRQQKSGPSWRSTDSGAQQPAGADPAGSGPAQP